MEIAIQVENITKIFKSRSGEKRVLDNFSFFVKKGSIVGFIGPNGAGKTTTIKIILDLIKLTSGRITLLGREHNQREIKQIIGYMPEKDVFYDDMYPLEFLVYFGTLSGMSKERARESAMNLLNVLGLNGALDTKIKNFSSGMKKKISFAQAIIHDPKILILDEPTANLDPLAQEQLLSIIKELQRRGATILISSHNIEELEKVIDSVVVINKGRLILDSPLEKLREASTHGIELNVSNAAKAASVLSNYKTNLIDRDTLIVDTLPQEKNKIIRVLMDSNIQINSVSSRRQSLWDIILAILKQNG